MKEEFSYNLQHYRKQMKLTQEQLAAKLGVTFQAVSKWENGLTYPDMEILPKLAAILKVQIDSLLGYQAQKLKTTDYQTYYHSDEYYWGNRIWSVCYDILKLRPPVKSYQVLDVGCGEGQAAVFFAKNGYHVSAYDIASKGIEKGIQLAERNHVEVDFFEADIMDYNTNNQYDIVYGSGVLQYLPEWRKKRFFENLKEHTNIGGIHVFNVFVEKPYLTSPPDWEDTEAFWKTGELFGYYSDWKILRMEEVVFNCDSSGVAHQHCMNVVIAEKIV